MASLYEAHAKDGPHNAHYDRPAMLALIGEVNGLQVLDAGCGPGYYAEALLARGASVVAIDESPRMLDLARRRLGPAMELLRTDLNDPLPFVDESFDLVVCPLVIHYLDDRAATLREFFRILRPPGRVVLSTNHPTNDWLRKGGSYFETRQEEDVWGLYGGAQRVRFWREPLTAFCASVADAGFLIERLIEPLPEESMRENWPDDWERLHREPNVLLLRLLKPGPGLDDVGTCRPKAMTAPNSSTEGNRLD
jgi:SAM-dependent methyltransferase